MTAVVRLLAILLGATAPEEPMSQLMALDEAAAFARRVRERRDFAGRNVQGAHYGHTHAGVSA
ncbi:hypothetical protein AB0B30_27710 [Streptomyces narbonensis]|uniref:Uncharacterized protein n=1 Tax=Streptomyces narbonensis TaxID=67333 RepID=A0ABV3CEJ2_9ACTN